MVARIPAGFVLTYGDVAELLGRGGARAVGRAMALEGAGLPWHRVVRASGRPAAGHEERALALLAAEGCPLRTDGQRVDLARARWDGRPAPRR